MRIIRSLRFQTVPLVLSGAVFLLPAAYAQNPAPPPQPSQTDDVIRIKTELVRTDITVVDRQGRFVEGLNPEQFELRVEGRVQPIAFFERVRAGSPQEEKQLAAAGIKNDPGTDRPADTPGKPEQLEDRGRIIFFFVDDVHLENESLGRTRASLLRFVEKQMTDNDRVAIISTSGQIGFLQQLTDNKAVLREAIDRLHYKKNVESSSMKVRISEVDANLIANHRDVRLFQYLVEATQNEFQTDLMNAAMLVRQRVRSINAQSRPIEDHTLYGLENLMRSSASLVGRKLVFFISDGFIVDVRKSHAPEILRRVTDEAARVGAVVYTLDSRAIFSDPQVDATTNGYLDFSSRQGGRLLAESKMPQEALVTLAAETGGRSFLNPNDFDEALTQAIRETSDYYLLDWRPDTESQRAGKALLEVVVRGRPDLRVRMRRNILALKSAETAGVRKKESSGTATPEDELRTALGSLYPRRELPTSLSAGYVRTPNNAMLLNVSMQLDGFALNFDETASNPGGNKASEVDVLGVALDDRGSFSSFKQKLTVLRDAVFSKNEHYVQWNQSLPLPPGLYQVRVAVRERNTGHTGSAMQWLEIPEIDPAGMALSNIFIGERKNEAGNIAQKVAVNVDHSFARHSSLRYQAYLYDPGRAPSSSDISLEVKLLRGNRAVLTLPDGKLGAASVSDPSSFPLSGEINLEQLPPGRYTLQISVTDRTTKKSVSQQTQFTIN